jgi:polyisoprenoid-binding protein YceI
LRHTRLSTAIAGALLLLALAACGGTTSQSPTSVPAEPAAQPTAEVALPATAAPAAQPTTAPAASTSESAAPTTGTEATTAPEASSAGLRSFAIVPEQTEASYEVQEQFLNRDLPNKAIGRTNSVEGTFQFDASGRPTGQVTEIKVDLRTLTSDRSMRDQRIRREWLESDTYPYATFVSTGVEGVPESYTEGQDVSFKLLGNLTIREVTKPVTFDVTGKLEGDTVSGIASTSVLMKDFGFDPPTVAGVLTVQDGVTINVNFTAKESAAS